MKKYVIANISMKYENEVEVFFTRNGRNYLLVTDALWNPIDRDDILPDGYDLFIEGDEEGEWLKITDEYAGINYASFYEALKMYYKQEEINQRGAY